MKKYYYKNYWYAKDLEDPKSLTLTIKAVKEKKVFGGKKEVVYFEESEKALALNGVNSRKLWNNFWGTNYWIGRKITIFRSHTTLNGERVPCIRIRISKAELEKFRSER